MNKTWADKLREADAARAPQPRTNVVPIKHKTRFIRCRLGLHSWFTYRTGIVRGLTHGWQIGHAIRCRRCHKEKIV
jgi:hypothetical protein